MRIDLITRRYPPQIGGAERVLSYLAEALAAHPNASVRVLTCGDPRSGLASHETQTPVPVVRLATSRLRFIGTWKYMNALRRELESAPPDVAYVSMLKHDAYVAVGVGRRLGFPVVLRPEGAGATGDVAWQAWGRFGQRIARRCRDADAFVAISPAIRRELENAGYGEALGRIHDLPNGVPIPAERWRWRGRTGGDAAPRAVFVGRLAPEKNLVTLVNAWSLVAEQQPGAKLTLVGGGPELPAIEETARKLNLSQNVALIGPVSDASSFLRESDLFILPSIEEGMSIALLEAMALGMPVAASGIEGNRRLVADGVEGRLFPPNDSSAIRDVVLDLWRDPARSAAMGGNARDRVEKEFSIKRVAVAHIELFGSLIDGNRPARRPKRE